VTECHSQIDELLSQRPELLGQVRDEEEKKSQETEWSQSCITNQCPFTLIGNITIIVLI
jgi:hypothetical protein